MIVNTLSNYIKLFLGIFITVFMTRLLFLGLTREEYGIWALLWSIFGYSLLLDFGFGAAIQKVTSQTLVNKDWNNYNRVVSTVFFNYLGMSLIVTAVTVLLARNLDNLFHFSNPSLIPYYQKIFILFGLGTAVVFPFGFFVEVLRGLHKIQLRNNIQMVFKVLNFLLIYFVVKMGFALFGMTVVTIVISLLTNATMAFFAYRNLPSLKISPRNYDFKQLKSVMAFSIFAYVITFSNLIIYQTDQLVISLFASVSLVAVYQISSKLALTFKGFSTQFLDNLTPVAATLFASKQENKLAKIFVESDRLLGFIATMLFIPIVVFVRPLLNIWLELNDPDGIRVAIILMVSIYIIVSFRSSSAKILLMGDKYRNLSIVAIIECAANLGLSIYLIRYFGIVGVAIGTLVPNVIMAVVFNIPVGLKFAGLSFKDYFNLSLKNNLFIGGVTFLVAYGLRMIYTPANFFQLLALFSFITLFYLVIYYKFGTYGWEKKQLKSYLTSKFK